jgi:hypothetical protein
VHLTCAKAYESHERLAQSFLAHATEADVGAIAWRIGAISHRAAFSSRIAATNYFNRRGVAIAATLTFSSSFGL